MNLIIWVIIIVLLLAIIGGAIASIVLRNKKVVDKFRKLPNIGIRKLADRKMMKSYKKIEQDFAGKGISLYMITWDDEAQNVDSKALGSSMGFLGDEVRRRYPKNVVNLEDFLWLSINSKEVKKDKDLRKIFLINSPGLWMLR